ncbi:hypothetical protein BBO99_00005446 [Phytophthora kernoviae]|uniref:Uncharacterized protein n=2 Tax=Phytophthora kernoviae TaxID=325452 RepID=A0A3R7KTN3_9STRA|nr:hypothetical protein G195_009632 [Phytophthora kernoviae 00238/432]KAG2516826.1 hypothetical protein JM18_007682 [Phytophthora kernoviae]RLN31480.1 hypothetical protein BBI17_005791 [Phytophthora kernoviae]RLN79186.1 hypothetical protein BBO99_00005446 [Phytophthora kernoviae]
MNMEMEMIGDSGPRMSLQFVESRFVPFSFVRIGDHAWSFLSGSNGHEDFQMHQGNEMYGHCTVTSPDGLAQLLGNIAVRRCVFEPSEEDPENATVFRTCARMTPSLSDSASIAASVGNMTDVIIQNYEKSVVYIFDAVLESLANQGK